jgi:hypothetical protein
MSKNIIFVLTLFLTFKTLTLPQWVKILYTWYNVKPYLPDANSLDLCRPSVLLASLVQTGAKNHGGTIYSGLWVSYVSFRCFPLLSVFKTFMVSAIFPHVCPAFNIF